MGNMRHNKYKIKEKNKKKVRNYIEYEKRGYDRRINEANMRKSELRG